MADQVTDQVYGFDGPTGWKVDTDTDRATMFSVGGLPLADEHRLKVARANFPEAQPEDFEQQGKDWVERATGVRHRIVGFDPSLSEDPRDTGVTTFFVTEDGHLAYLRPVGVEGRSRSVVQGNVGVVDR
jgi:hypothetical protein